MVLRKRVLCNLDTNNFTPTNRVTPPGTQPVAIGDRDYDRSLARAYCREGKLEVPGMVLSCRVKFGNEVTKFVQDAAEYQIYFQNSELKLLD